MIEDLIMVMLGMGIGYALANILPLKNGGRID